MTQWKGKAVGWSSPAEKCVLRAARDHRRGDEELLQYKDANYNSDELAALKTINLNHTQATDAAVTVLAIACPGLRCINLINTQVTNATATALATTRAPACRSSI
jgi:hypothetical protein